MPPRLRTVTKLALELTAKNDGSQPKRGVDGLVTLTQADMEQVNALIRARMDSPVPVIPALADHLIAAGGKRLRPLLTVAAHRLAGGKDDAGVKLAAAVEFVHTATLLHDDVVDSSDLRRGKVAAHLIWGAAPAVLVGDFLFARAFELMVETGSIRALGVLARASSVIAEGEVLALSRANDLSLEHEVYLKIIECKTAELFAAAGESGAVAARASEPRISALRAYGMNLGMAFQLVDDALDYGGATQSLGKNAGDDFRAGKPTMPLLLAVKRTGAGEAKFWERTIVRREQTDDDFRRARELVLATGALQATFELAREYTASANGALTVFEAGEMKTALEDLADFAVSRAS